MNLYSRARKHINMDRVKELLEERIKREQIAEILQQQDKIRAELKEIEREESKHCNWRKELEEGMTTAGLGMINLDAAGDVDLSTNDVGASASYSQSSNAQFSGSQATFNFSGSASVGQTYLRQGFFNQIDATKFDSFVNAKIHPPPPEPVIFAPYDAFCPILIIASNCSFDMPISSKNF